MAGGRVGGGCGVGVGWLRGQCKGWLRSGVDITAFAIAVPSWILFHSSESDVSELLSSNDLRFGSCVLVVLC